MRVLTGVLLRKCSSPEQMVLSIVSASQYFVHTPDEPIPQKGVNTKYLLEPTKERMRIQGIQDIQNHNVWVYIFEYVQHTSKTRSSKIFSWNHANLMALNVKKGNLSAIWF